MTISAIKNFPSQERKFFENVIMRRVSWKFCPREWKCHGIFAAESDSHSWLPTTLWNHHCFKL